MIARYKYPIALVLAALCAVGAVFLTKFYFDAKERELRDRIRNEAKLTDVVVAKRDLAMGEPVSLDTMMIKSIPLEFVPDGSIRPEQYPTVENKTLSSPMSAGKPLLRHFVEGMTRVEKFSDLLAVGERAITLEVDGVTSIEHMIQAGDFIDLAVSSQRGRSFDLLLERIKVLSTGNYTVSDPEVPGLYKQAQYSTVTLGVDGRYIQDIYEAEAAGELVFLLRNERDKSSPLYELSNAKAAGNVAVYSGGAVTDMGVLKEETDLIDIENNAKSEAVIRNSKGRIMRLAKVKNAELKKEDSNELVSSR